MTTAPNTLDTVIATNMKKLRERQELSQVELARRLGCSRHRVMELEGRQGGRRPAFTWQTLLALCQILECPIWELVLPPDEVDVKIDGQFVRVATREYLADILFAVPSKDLASFADRRREKREEMEAKVKQLLRIIDEQLGEDT